MVRWTVLAVLLLVAGCRAAGEGVASGSEHYAFAGCEPRTVYCPNDATLGCALEELARKHGACEVDADCVRVEWESNCAGQGVCEPRPAVNARNQAAFARESSAELERYCAQASCHVSASCPESEAFRPACVEGRCQSVRL